MELEAKFGELEASLTEDHKTVMIGRDGSWLHVHKFCRDTALRGMTTPADLRGWIERRYGELLAELHGL